jgi:rhamnosyltransferase
VDVTIFIRARNEAAFIKDCLNSIFSQDFDGSFEVILLDSGSSDETVSFAKAFRVTVYEIPPALFTFSSALNAGVALSKAQFFVPLSAHSIPKGRFWLRELITPLRADASLAATYSRQIPWPDASIPEMLGMQRTFKTTDFCLSPDYFQLSLTEQRNPTSSAMLSNASAAYRREVLLQYPFRDVPGSEDRCCAIELLGAGFSILYASQSVVTHLHYPSFKDFRVIARDAILARFLINQHIAPPSKFKQHVKTRDLIWSYCKIPLSIIWLAITTVIPLFPGRKNPRRELDWRIASLGTTLGKFEGFLLARRESGGVPKPAPAQPILDALRPRQG